MKKIFNIEGMHCISCAKSIELELEDSVNSIKVDYNTKKAIVEFDERKITEKQIKGIIEKIGYKIKEVK